jgi:hypothetical protein
MSTFVRFLVAVTLVATVTACGHDSAPTTPSAAPAASSTPAPGAVNGATVNGTNPGPDADNQGAAEVNGTINAGSLSGSCAARNLSFSIGMTRVTTTASTQFRDGTCEALKAGSRDEVKGTRQADNSITAATVEGGDDNDDNDDDHDADHNGAVEVNGTIAAGSLAGACASNSLSFRVGSTLVHTGASTQFKDTSCAALKAGDSVEVKGSRQADAAVLASRVEKRK